MGPMSGAIDRLQPAPILQAGLLDPPWQFPKGQSLPGTCAIAPSDWIRLDDAYAEQMALRDRLVAERLAQVYAVDPSAQDAAQEALSLALQILEDLPGFSLTSHQVQRPDGVRVDLDRGQPLKTLGRLIQEDICLLRKADSEHVLTGAFLCFPASWTLAEKMGRPLSTIHGPVADYDANITRRVQRLFDAIQPGRPIMRANCLSYERFELFQPRRETDPRRNRSGPSHFIRQERQCLVRLPETRAVLFSIHTSVVHRQQLDPDTRAALDAHLSVHDTG